MAILRDQTRWASWTARSLACALTFCSMVHAAPEGAQSPERMRARTLFAQGEKLYKAARYLDAMREQGTPVDAEAFAREMAVFAAQRNAKIVGIFARLDRRDGKPRYLSYLPRVWSYLAGDLEHPALAPLKSWYDRAIPAEARSVPRGEGA